MVIQLRLIGQVVIRTPDVELAIVYSPSLFTVITTALKWGKSKIS